MRISDKPGRETGRAPEQQLLHQYTVQRVFSGGNFRICGHRRSLSTALKSFCAACSSEEIEVMQRTYNPRMLLQFRRTVDFTRSNLDSSSFFSVRLFLLIVKILFDVIRGAYLHRQTVGPHISMQSLLMNQFTCCYHIQQWCLHQWMSKAERAPKVELVKHTDFTDDASYAMHKGS